MLPKGPQDQLLTNSPTSAMLSSPSLIGPQPLSLHFHWLGPDLLASTQIGLSQRGIFLKILINYHFRPLPVLYSSNFNPCYNSERKLPQIPDLENHYVKEASGDFQSSARWVLKDFANVTNSLYLVEVEKSVGDKSNPSTPCTKPGHFLFPFTPLLTLWPLFLPKIYNYLFAYWFMFDLPLTHVQGSRDLVCSIHCWIFDVSNGALCL